MSPDLFHLFALAFNSCCTRQASRHRTRWCLHRSLLLLKHCTGPIIAVLSAYRVITDPKWISKSIYWPLCIRFWLLNNLHGPGRLDHSAFSRSWRWSHATSQIWMLYSADGQADAAQSCTSLSHDAIVCARSSVWTAASGYLSTLGSCRLAWTSLYLSYLPWPTNGDHSDTTLECLLIDSSVIQLSVARVGAYPRRETTFCVSLAVTVKSVTRMIVELYHLSSIWLFTRGHGCLQSGP